MGKTDPTQSKIPFATKRNLRGADAPQTSEEQRFTATETAAQEDDLRSILLEVRSSLKTIDIKIDALQSGLDSVKQKVVVHENRLDIQENRDSDTQDAHTETRSQILGMEKVLEAIKNKNEDLEARSRRNNLRILGLPESTAITKMEPYTDNLLKELFDPSLSPFMLVLGTQASSWQTT